MVHCPFTRMWYGEGQRCNLLLQLSIIFLTCFCVSPPARVASGKNSAPRHGDTTAGHRCVVAAALQAHVPCANYRSMAIEEEDWLKFKRGCDVICDAKERRGMTSRGTTGTMWILESYARPAGIYPWIRQTMAPAITLLLPEGASFWSNNNFTFRAFSTTFCVAIQIWIAVFTLWELRAHAPRLGILLGMHVIQSDVNPRMCVCMYVCMWASFTRSVAVHVCKSTCILGYAFFPRSGKRDGSFSKLMNKITPHGKGWGSNGQHGFMHTNSTHTHTHARAHSHWSFSTSVSSCIIYDFRWQRYDLIVLYHEFLNTQYLYSTHLFLTFFFVVVAYLGGNTGKHFKRFSPHQADDRFLHSWLQYCACVCMLVHAHAFVRVRPLGSWQLIQSCNVSSTIMTLIRATLP